MEIKRKIRFTLRRYGKDHYQIRMRTSFHGCRLDLSTGYQISNPCYWNEQQQLITNDFIEMYGETANGINSHLKYLQERMGTAFKFFEVDEKMPTVTELKQRFLLLTGRQDNRDIKNKTVQIKNDGGNETHKIYKFFDIFDLFVKECGEKNAWTRATIQKMDALKHDLISFKSTLSFDDIAEEATLIGFVSYLRNTKQLRTPRKAKGEREKYDKDDIIGIQNNTIEKKLSYLRWYMNWATDHGYNSSLTYKAFRPTLKTTQKKVIFLTIDELSRLINMKFNEDTKILEPVRDKFVFGCFTGLRYSDANNLKRSDIKGNHIEVTTIKTEDSLIIELNEVALGILDKYKDIVFPDNKALPSLSNQKFNVHLKELCKLAGINEKIRITSYNGNERKDIVKEKWELIGSHCGRRTFVVNALSLNIPPNIVMKWTGHSDYKAMKPYIDIVDQIKAAEMNKFNSLLTK